MKTGVENYIFWSEIGSGFEEPGGTPPTSIQRSTLPLPSSPTSVPAPPPERPGASCSQAKVQGWIKHFFYSPKPRQPRKNLIYPRSYLSIHILRFSYNTSLK